MPNTEHMYFLIDILNESAPNPKKYGCCQLKTSQQQTVSPNKKNPQAGNPRQNYICVDKDEAFKINVSAIDQNDRNTYGAVLYLDGQRVHGKKTFVSKTMFHGFKLGGGQFRQFIFSTPQVAGMQEPGTNQNDPNALRQKLQQGRTDSQFQSKEEFLDQKYKDRKGTIIIEFYQTEQFERPNKGMNKVHTKTYETHFIEDVNKKSAFADSVRIKQGNVFTLAKKIDQRGSNMHHGGNGNNFRGGYQNNNNHHGNNNHHNNSNHHSNNNHGEFQGGRRRDDKFNEKFNNNRDRNDRHHNNNRFNHNNNNNSDRGGRTMDMSKRNHDPRRPIPGGTITESGMIVDYKVNYDQLVDSIVINYADWSYLQMMNYVSVYNYDNLKMIPKSLMNSHDFIYKVLFTIIKNEQKMHYKHVNSEFYRVTGFKISDYFDFKDEDMKQFLEMKEAMFQIDNKGYAQVNQSYNEEEQNNLMRNRSRMNNNSTSGGSARQKNVETIEIID
eukprot:403335754